MKLAGEITIVSSGSGSGRIPIKIKQDTMLALIAGQKDLHLETALEITKAEQGKFTKGKWELHSPVKNDKGEIVSYASPNNRAVVNAKGEVVTVLSRTMLVYFLEKFSTSLTKASRETALEIVKGFESSKSSVLGEEGHKALSRVLASQKAAK